jgi:hypothetical protein
MSTPTVNGWPDSTTKLEPVGYVDEASERLQNTGTDEVEVR